MVMMKTKIRKDSGNSGDSYKKNKNASLKKGKKRWQNQRNQLRNTLKRLFEEILNLQTMLRV
jgi:hypothetical protein